MAKPLSKTQYDELRTSIMDFVAAHPDPAMAPFKASIASSASTWRDDSVAPIAASRFLRPALDHTIPTTRHLVDVFEKYHNALKWEQSYKATDKVVGKDMLDGYGFVEVIGKNGPFVSTTVRSGIGVWGPDIDYPEHNHEAEEVYVPLAGQADFTLDKGPYKTHLPGDVIYVPSNLRHGFRTTSNVFVVFYIWQAGDLRQKSTF